MKTAVLGLAGGLWAGLVLAVGGGNLPADVRTLTIALLGALAGGLGAFAVTRRAWRGGG